MESLLDGPGRTKQPCLARNHAGQCKQQNILHGTQLGPSEAEGED